MDFSWGYLLQGFATALTAQNLLWALLGCFIGTLVGVLPGIGPVSGIAILLPLTTVLPPTSAIIIMAAIYYGQGHVRRIHDRHRGEYPWRGFFCVQERRTQDVTVERRRDQARQALRQRKSDEVFQDWVRQTRDRSYVEIRVDER